MGELMCEIKYRSTVQENLSKSIEGLYVQRLKKCYELMDVEKQESLKVSINIYT